MKIKYLFLTIAAALIAGCSDELDRGRTYNSEKGVTATIPTYPFDDGTRVNISDDLQTFTWSDGDELGLYYQGSGSTAHAGFTITAGGGSTGTFVNEAFILKKSSTYYAFYPFNESATIASSPVDFTGQVQNGNGSAAHLGGYNYMYSTVNTDGSGNASIQFKNLGSVMQLQLTVSNAATYTGIDITSDGAEFITKGTASMTDGSITATETSASIHLDLENGIALNEGGVLTANLLVSPVDMSGSTLMITLTDTEEKTYEVTTTGKNMLQGKAYLYAEAMPDEELDSIPYVTFTADAEQTFQMSAEVSTLEYSVNGSDWAELGTTLVTFGGEHGKLRLRGNSSAGTNGTTISFGNATKVACRGDIRTLIDYENYDTADTSEAFFKYLFQGCTSLTQAPELPATTLIFNCYDSMFQGCTSLVNAPELPAIMLAPSCYQHMFQDCTSLINAPELPAKTLTRWCYNGMFQGCTSLINAPALPATTLAEYCYYYMFDGCTSLVNASELSATTLAPSCYSAMFRGCTSLVSAPELPTKTLTYFCYGGMFMNCTSLVNAPTLPATTLADECYAVMFSGCTSLVNAPALPATALTSACYSSMFSNCISLVNAPVLPAKTLASYCYSSMFYGCNNLKYIKMMATDISASSCLSSWVDGVAINGTFVKNSAATWDINGYNGIPYGWTVKTANK